VSLELALQQAKRGDRGDGRLLMLHDARLRRHIERRLTPGVQALVSAEDVLQETYIEAYRHIAQFHLRVKTRSTAGWRRSPIAN